MHTFPHRTFAICKVPTVNPSGKNQRFLPAPFGKGALRAVPAANFAPGLLGIVTSLTRPVSLLRHLSEQRIKAPLAKGGCLGNAEAGG